MIEMLLTQVDEKKFTDTERVERWLASFERALNALDRSALEDLFADECHWRDLLAFTWNITPHDSKAEIINNLIDKQPYVQAHKFSIAVGRTPPRRIKRVGVEVVESIFTFETLTGRAQGLLRILAERPDQAWILSTSLCEIKGHEVPIDSKRPSGDTYSRIFGGENWADRRAKEQAFEDREPTVLIIGAGQSGLSLAARLRLLGVDALCVDKEARVGDTWRHRYHSLALHNQVALNQMAHMPFPPSWPKYLPKDMLANWIENYAWAMECNVWTSTNFIGAKYDNSGGHWNAKVQRSDGSERVLRAKHLVFANGIVGAPQMPNIKGLDKFTGTLVHTHGYKDGANWKGKNALVIGAGTSGHDIAQDLHGHGANVKMLQRGAVTIVSVKAATLAYPVYYEENLPIEDADLIGTSHTFPLIARGAQIVAKRMQSMDQPLLDRLAERGFKMDLGEDGGGYQTRVRRSHSGYYLNCGCSELIADGQIGLIQSEDVDCFLPEGLLLKDGRFEKADIVVAATGYQSQQEVVRKYLGDEIANKVGPIWGLAGDGELNNMYRPTAQEGLWFMGSGLSQARIYSHFIALQIKARELEIIS